VNYFPLLLAMASRMLLRILPLLFLAFLLLGMFSFLSVAQVSGAPDKAAAPSSDSSLLSRHYREGEILVYHMKGSNRGQSGTTVYEAQATGVVKKNSDGKFIEECTWSNLVVNGAAVALSPAATNFRQVLSLDTFMGVPDLSQVIPLVGPITDLLTFYSDLLLASPQGSLLKAGDHFYFKHGTPNSWADGNYVLTGEDSIDFDVTLTGVDLPSKIATVVVRHVVPAQPQIKLLADWMRTPVSDTPNNWVQVSRNFDSKSDSDKYVAGAGKETFDVELKVSLADGRIVSGTLNNPVEVSERHCADLALTHCGDAVRYQILRQIEIQIQ
jgi:hypothetical protein